MGDMHHRIQHPFPTISFPHGSLHDPAKGQGRAGRGLSISQMGSLRPSAAGGHAQGQEAGHSPGLDPALPAPPLQLELQPLTRGFSTGRKEPPPATAWLAYAPQVTELPPLAAGVGSRRLTTP